VEQAWAPVTTNRAVSGIRPGALLGPAREVQAHDTTHGTDYARTLAAWLDHPDDPRRAADRLHVHPNTLRYRMARLSELVQIDLDDPQTRLALRLQLRALGH
jgi:DNA-binding PucR family transcriptional regulator